MLAPPPLAIRIVRQPGTLCLCGKPTGLQPGEAAAALPVGLCCSRCVREMDPQMAIGIAEVNAEMGRCFDAGLALGRSQAAA